MNITKISICLFYVLGAAILKNHIVNAEENAASIYEEAKKAFDSGLCADALQLLKRYKYIDSDYLAANPKKKNAVDKAIAYCEHASTYVRGKAHGADQSNRDYVSLPFENPPVSKPNLSAQR